MNNVIKTAFVFALLAVCPTLAFGADSPSKTNRGRRQGPPPEAYAACEDKNHGDQAQFVASHGQTVKGTCEMQGDRLVLRPDNHKGRAGGRRQGPPPEAYAACKDKNQGDEAQFVTSRGQTVKGTCEMQGDRLLLRPERHKGRAGGQRQGPPAEAYAACEGKNVGDRSQFVNSRGESVPGTCEAQGDKIVLRPDRKKR